MIQVYRRIISNWVYTSLGLITLLLLNAKTNAQSIQATSAPGSYNIKRNQPQKQRTDYALLIANDTYQDPYFKKLANPAYDARELEKRLRENFGFQTNLIVNVTRDSCMKLIRQYATRRYTPHDQLFVYFAGHGYFDEDLRQGYVVLKDSKGNDGARAQYLSFPELQNILSNLQCRHVLLTLDVCYGGTFDNYFAQASDDLGFRGDELTRGVKIEETGSVSSFIFEKLKPRTRLYLSSGGKETVSDGKAGEHSPFAKNLLAKLDEAAQSEYKILTINEVAVYLERQKLRAKIGPFGPNESTSDFLFIAH